MLGLPKTHGHPRWPTANCSKQYIYTLPLQPKSDGLQPNSFLLLVMPFIALLYIVYIYPSRTARAWRSHDPSLPFCPARASRPSSTAYGLVASTLGRATQWSKGLQLIQTMRGREPPISCFFVSSPPNRRSLGSRDDSSQKPHFGSPLQGVIRFGTPTYTNTETFLHVSHFVKEGYAFFFRFVFGSSFLFFCSLPLTAASLLFLPFLLFCACVAFLASHCFFAFPAFLCLFYLSLLFIIAL